MTEIWKTYTTTGGKTKKHELSENQKSLDYTKHLICRYETDLDHILQKYQL